MTLPDYRHFAEFAISLANESATAILPLFRKNVPVTVKAAAEWDPVTEADKSAERIIRHRIEVAFPDHGIIGEEYGTKEAKSQYTWVLDPVDGTRAFVIGMPTWGTLIALCENGRPVVGIMNQPYVGDMYFGTPEGAWLLRHGKREAISVKNTVALSEAMAGTTTPHLYQNKHAAGFERLRSQVKAMRYGGDAYFFCMLASGHLDIAMDCGLQIYDIAALIPIITGAGGYVGTWDGENPALGGNIIAASSKPLFEEAASLMR